MARLISIAGSLALFVGAAQPLPCQATPADSVTAVRTVDQFQAALAAGDSARAAALLADDALIVEGGVIQTRAEYLGGHLAADIKASRGPQGERSLVTVSMMGDAAVIVSKTVHPPSSAPGSTGSELAELMVVSKGATGWRIRAVHWSSRRRRPASSVPSPAM